jgi:type II secretory pathway pseudopilin PulG
MNGNPPPIPSAPAQKSGMPTWAITMIVLGIVGVVGIAVIGMLAAIAIPNFVKARETAQMNACINQLRLIDSAKRQWALEYKKEMTDAPTEDEVAAYLKDRQFPICPAGGIYTIETVGESPARSVPKHQLAIRPAFPNQ